MTSPSTVVRMLHTSDVHITGVDSVNALRSVIDIALETEVDIALIAGDLFDSSRVADDAVALVLAELARMSQPVVVIPGNHDCVDEHSIYHRVDLRAAGSHVFFASDPVGEELVFEDLALTIWARGIENHEPQHRPLEGYIPTSQPHWRVVLTHGHYVPTGEASYRSSPIAQQEIAELACDYLALGHWHRYLDVSEGSVRAFYSGSPWEPIRESGTVNLVTLDADGPRVERLPIAPRPL